MASNKLSSGTSVQDLDQNFLEMEGPVGGLPFVFLFLFLIYFFLFFLVRLFLKQEKGSISINQEVVTTLVKLVKEPVNKKGASKHEELPEDVLEYIFARTSFPTILNLTKLSKSWRMKFLSSSLSPSLLQKEVCSLSSKWATYCPTFFTNDGIIGFDQTLSQWKLVASYPRLSSRPESISSSGALVCLTSFLNPRVGVEYIVFNVLTKSTRLLKVPHSELCDTLAVRLVSVGSFAYKLMVNALKEISRGDVNVVEYIHVVYTYDSQTDSWTETEMVSGLNLHALLGTRSLVQHTTCVNGIWYGLRKGRPQWDGTRWAVWSFNTNASSNVETSKFRSNRFPYDNLYVMAFLRLDDLLARILVYGERIIVFFCNLRAIREIPVPNGQRCFYCTPLDSILICELDVVSLHLKQISKGPHESMTTLVCELGSRTRKYLSCIQFSLHENRIYFGRNNPFVPVLTFDLDTNQWGRLPTVPESLCPMTKENHVTWGACPFQPGLNPFA